MWLKIIQTKMAENILFTERENYIAFVYLLLSLEN